MIHIGDDLKIVALVVCHLFTHTERLGYVLRISFSLFTSFWTQNKVGLVNEQIPRRTEEFKGLDNFKTILYLKQY